jgi:bifunctional non-homologous end joining protein LigD
VAYTISDLEAADQHVAEGEQRVARQREIVRELAAYPQACRLAEDVLAQFETALHMHREHRNRVRREVLGRPADEIDLCTIELMRATNHPPFSRAGWIFEFKWDGYRVLASKDQLVTGKKNDATGLYPEIVQALGKLRGSFVLDGEVCSLGVTGTPDFEKIDGHAARKRGEFVTFFAFDLLFVNGRDLRRLPLLERKRRLRKLIPADRSRLRCVEFTETEGLFLFRQAVNVGLDGVVGKRADSPYVGGNSRDWLKSKPGHDDDWAGAVREGDLGVL